MNFKKVITLTLATLLLLTTFVGCKKNANDDTVSNASESSNTVYGKVEIEDADNTQIDSENTTSTDDISSDTVASEDTSNATSNDASTTVSDPSIVTNPDGIEILGSGTKDDPYYDTPNADSHSVKTVKIPAGKSIFYGIYRVGGRILTINDSSAYVVCNGTKHTAKDGKVNFKVVDALASDAVIFEIGNTDSTEKSFTIKFADVEGSMANPTVLKTVGNKITINLEEGNETGHFYKYTSEKAGTLKIYILSDSEKGILIATNNRNSAQRSTDSDEELKSDDTGKYIELEVQKGDEIIINAGIKPNKRGKYAATVIEWTADY